MKIEIRSFIESDIPAADKVGQSAFNHINSIADALRLFLYSQPDGLFVAIIDDEIAGTGGIIDYGSYCFIGSMTVHQKFQSQGVGKAIFKHLLKHWENKGKPPIFLDASDIGGKLYSQFNFQGLDSVFSYVIKQIPEKPVIPARSNIRSMLSSDLDSIIKFDTPVFGADRGMILKNLMRIFPDRGFITSQNNEITGFTFCQFQRIGPWITHDSEIAEALLQAALTLPYEVNPSVAVPGINNDAISLLKKYNFEKTISNTHMGCGSPKPAVDRKAVFGQTSFGLG